MSGRKQIQIFRRRLNRFDFCCSMFCLLFYRSLFKREQRDGIFLILFCDHNFFLQQCENNYPKKHKNTKTQKQKHKQKIGLFKQSRSIKKNHFKGFPPKMGGINRHYTHLLRKIWYSLLLSPPLSPSSSPPKISLSSFLPSFFYPSFFSFKAIMNRKEHSLSLLFRV